MRYLLLVTYNGKNYNGYQIQPNGSTIQQKLENAIKTLKYYGIKTCVVVKK